MTTEIAELITTLKERYALPVKPVCWLCGGPMAIGMIESGRTEWRCNGPEAAWFGMEEGQEKRDRERHYLQSIHIQSRKGDHDVLRLIELCEIEFAKLGGI